MQLDEEQSGTLRSAALGMVDKVVTGLWPMWAPQVNARPPGSVPVLRVTFNVVTTELGLHTNAATPRSEVPEQPEDPSSRREMLLAIIDEWAKRGWCGVVVDVTLESESLDFRMVMVVVPDVRGAEPSA